VLVTARSRAADAACHRCGLSSARVNSRYRRRLHDLAAGGRPVTIDLEVRRFFCGNPECELQTFANAQLKSWHILRKIRSAPGAPDPAPKPSTSCRSAKLNRMKKVHRCPGSVQSRFVAELGNWQFRCH
jgi:transposase